MRRLRLVVAALMLLGFSTGCAGLLEFRPPAEFRGKKVKEDPPGTYAPELMRRELMPC